MDVPHLSVQNEMEDATGDNPKDQGQLILKTLAGEASLQPPLSASRVQTSLAIFLAFLRSFSFFPAVKCLGIALLGCRRTQT